MSKDVIAAVRKVAEEYRRVAMSGKYPKAPTRAAIVAAWRSAVKDHPAWAPHESLFIRIAEGR